MSDATITPYRNGPYLVRGDFRLLDPQGDQIELRRATIALCRCGQSRSRPFCDGTHKLIDFKAEATLPATRLPATVRPPAPDPAAEDG